MEGIENSSDFVAFSSFLVTTFSMSFVLESKGVLDGTGIKEAVYARDIPMNLSASSIGPPGWLISPSLMGRHSVTEFGSSPEVSYRLTPMFTRSWVFGCTRYVVRNDL
jgi:hypothetical protein